MSDDVTDHARDLIGAYALDAVDDVERRAVERLVASDPDAARELAELRATAAMLGSAAAAAPPPGLRAGVLDAITRVPQVGVQPRAGTVPADGPASTVVDLTTRRPRRTTTWLAIAATAVGAAAIPSALAIQQAQQAQRAEQRAEAVADLLADPQAQVVRAEVTGGGTAVGVLAGDRALFTATGLEDPGAGQEYQLWVIRDGEALPDAVMPDDAGAVQAVTDGYRPGDALAVTVEPASGSPQPTTDPVVLLAPSGA
jgi:anti-sigma-K factor RskA